MKITFTSLFLAEPTTLQKVKRIVVRGNVIFQYDRKGHMCGLEVFDRTKPLEIEDEENIDEIYPNKL